MTDEELDGLWARAASWPQDAQIELAQTMLDIEARYIGVYITTKEERMALKRSHDDVQAGRFATDAEVERIYRKFGNK